MLDADGNQIEYRGYFQICSTCGAHSKLVQREFDLEIQGWVVQVNNNMCPECVKALRDMIRSYRREH